jgi:hypothetical protein
VRLGRQVHDAIGLVLVEQPLDLCGVADIDLSEVVPRAIGHIGQRFQVARVGELIDVDNGVVGLAEELPVAGSRRTQ